MKAILLLFALMILASVFAFSQIKDTTAARQEQKQVQQKKMDKFIDRDGDGICDRREDGLGFRRSRHRAEKQRGKNQAAQSGKGTGSTIQPTGSGAGQQYRGGK